MGVTTSFLAFQSNLYDLDYGFKVHNQLFRNKQPRCFLKITREVSSTKVHSSAPSGEGNHGLILNSEGGHSVHTGDIYISLIPEA